MRHTSALPAHITPNRADTAPPTPGRARCQSGASREKVQPMLPNRAQNAIELSIAMPGGADPGEGWRMT